MGGGPQNRVRLAEDSRWLPTHAEGAIDEDIWRLGRLRSDPGGDSLVLNPAGVVLLARAWRGSQSQRDK